MWVIFKLTAMLVTYFVRTTSAKFSSLKSFIKERINGIDFYINIIKSKHGIVAKEYIFEFDSKIIFKLSKEGYADMYFKYWGFSDEIQTGDQDFDRLIYISCDHVQFRQKIINDARLRELIKVFFENECESIITNGHTIVFRIKGDRILDDSLKTYLVEAYKLFSEMKNLPDAPMLDAFVAKMIVAEACVWSLATYAVLSFLDLLFLNQGDVHLDQIGIIKSGLLLGLAISILALIIIYVFFKGSSRGHRIFMESFLVLLFSIPVGGISFICDLNTELDKSPTTEIAVNIQKLEKREHRRRKGGVSYSYHLYGQQITQKEKFDLPYHIKISSDQYRLFMGKESAVVYVREGWLNFQWIEDIQQDRGY